MPKVEQKYLNRAKKTELKVLYSIFKHGETTDVDLLCKETEESREAVNAALAFWRCAGVIGENEDEEKAPCVTEKAVAKEEKKPAEVKPSSTYTLMEIA